MPRSTPIIPELEASLCQTCWESWEKHGQQLITANEVEPACLRQQLLMRRLSRRVDICGETVILSTSQLFEHWRHVDLRWFSSPVSSLVTTSKTSKQQNVIELELIIFVWRWRSCLTMGHRVTSSWSNWMLFFLYSAPVTFQRIGAKQQTFHNIVSLCV